MSWKIVRRILGILIALELAYLGVFNIALNLNLTQDLINRVKPDKFNVSWDSAWTPWPFRVYARGISVNGQSKSQQWELNTPEASGSITLLPIVFKHVYLNDIEARDVVYRQRPRPKEGRDLSSIRPFFPPITGRELETAPPPPPPAKTPRKPWKIHISDIQAAGEHKIWLYQIQAHLTGSATTSLSVETRGGPFSLDQGKVDLQLNSLSINDNQNVASNGTLNGSVLMHPFRVSENRGLKSLTYLDLDLDIHTRTESLAFLNFYLRAFRDMRIDGSGTIDGRLRFADNRLLAGSDLDVSADQLQLTMLDYLVEGDGDVQLRAAEDREETDFAIAFNDLNAYYGDLEAPLLKGNGLAVNGAVSRLLIPTGESRPEAKRLALTIASLEVPDLALYQRFLPDIWKITLQGGEGTLRGQLAGSQEELHGDFTLTSESAKVGIRDLSFQSDLDVGLKVHSPELGNGTVDISGTYFKLGESQLSRDQSSSEPWYAEINIEQGVIHVPLEDDDTEQNGARRVYQVFTNKEVGELLADSEEIAKISGRISDLAWLNVLFENPYELQIHGRGGIESELVLKKGQLGTGSRMEIIPQALAVEFLDYRADGDGNIKFEVTQGGENPDVELEITLEDAELRRKKAKSSMVEELALNLKAVAREVQLDRKEQDMQLHLQIPTARISDMTAYNALLPESSPLKILSGKASLTADITLEPEDASGYLNLQTDSLQARVDEQDIAARLSTNITLADGQPRDMFFDISGSTVRLDEVSVLGDEENFTEEDWEADIHFKQANAMWRQPARLNIDADLAMTNSIPLVSMLANHRGKHGWLENALTIDDVHGSVLLELANRQIVIPEAFVSSDNIDVGAKAVISEETRNGRVYLRYKALKGLLKIEDGKRNIDILGVEEKFNSYSTQAVLDRQDTVQ